MGFQLLLPPSDTFTRLKELALVAAKVENPTWRGHWQLRRPCFRSLDRAESQGHSIELGQVPPGSFSALSPVTGYFILPLS